MFQGQLKLSESTAARRQLYFHCVDATDGITPETGEAAGQPQISKNGGAWANTSATLTAIGNGRYYVVLTTGELNTLGTIEGRYKSANTAESLAMAMVVAYDPFSATNLGLSNIDAVLSTAFALVATAANLATAKTAIDAIKVKTDQFVFTLTNKVDAAILTGASFIQAAADKVWDTAARTLTAFGFSVTVGTNSDKTGYALSTAGILAIWHQLTSAIATSGTIGKLLKDDIDATISSRASQTSVDTIDDFLDTEIAAIKAKTDQLNLTSTTVDANITGGVTVTTNNDKTGYALSSAGVDAILDDAPSAELSAVPGDTATLRLMIQFLFQYFKFKRTSTATTETAFKTNGSTTLGTATLSDTGGTVTKGKMT